MDSVTPSMAKSAARFFLKSAMYSPIVLEFALTSGRLAHAAFSKNVKPPKPFIEEFAVSHREIVRGDPFTACFLIKDAKKARLEPVGWPVAVPGRGCVRAYPKETTDFWLTATGEDGQTDRVKFRVAVR